MRRVLILLTFLFVSTMSFASVPLKEEGIKTDIIQAEKLGLGFKQNKMLAQQNVEEQQKTFV